jgi:hypothetical protein
LHGGQVHGGHDHAVEEEAEIDRAEAAHGAGGLAGVAHFIKFQVGQYAGAPPEARIEEHRGTPVSVKAHHCQLPATPSVRTKLATRLGVSLEKVVATMERPASHQGTERPEAKNSAVLLPERFPKKSAGTRKQDGSGGDDPIKRVEVHVTFLALSAAHGAAPLTHI